jgi:4-hydroxybenzoate polyprenyltransferase
MPEVLPALFRATHPVPAAAVTALAGAVVAVRGAGPAVTALATASTLAGQLSVGWSNDYLDGGEDAAAGRRDKPIVAGEVSPSAVWWSATAAFPVSVALSIPLGLPSATVMAAALTSAWAYNLGLKRTVLSWAPYALSFGLAPVYLWLAGGEGLPEGWIVGAAACLGVAGHLTNVLPDLEADRARGARGLPHRLGPRGSLAAAAVALSATLGLALGLGSGPDGGTLAAAAVAAALVIAVVAAGAMGKGRAAFLLTIAAAAAVVAVFLLSAPR